MRKPTAQYVCRPAPRADRARPLRPDRARGGVWKARPAAYASKLSSSAGSCKTALQVRVRVDIPELLPELCDYLLRRGWAAVEVGLDEANVHARWAPSDFEAAIML